MLPVMARGIIAAETAPAGGEVHAVEEQLHLGRALEQPGRVAQRAFGRPVRPHDQQREGGMTGQHRRRRRRSEEHTSELQSLMRSSYAVFCLKKKKNNTKNTTK